MKGTLHYRLMNTGSKSEGHIAMLETAEGEYKLYREGGSPLNDDFFAPYDGLSVIIDGELEMPMEMVRVNEITINNENKN